MVHPSPSQATISSPSISNHLLNFKRGTKRDINAYPVLKDEKYFESFKWSVEVTAQAHDCEEILQHDFIPKSDADHNELFQLKQVFAYRLFNHCLLSDMGKTLV